MIIKLLHPVFIFFQLLPQEWIWVLYLIVFLSNLLESAVYTPFGWNWLSYGGMECTSPIENKSSLKIFQKWP